MTSKHSDNGKSSFAVLLAISVAVSGVAWFMLSQITNPDAYAVIAAAFIGFASILTGLFIETRNRRIRPSPFREDEKSVPKLRHRHHFVNKGIFSTQEETLECYTDNCRWQKHR